MKKLNLLEILDRLFILKPGEQKVIKEKIRERLEAGENDKNKS